MFYNGVSSDRLQFLSQGYGRENKSYIATQGPMEHTIHDFWKMVWSCESPAIIMITKLKEHNKVSKRYAQDFLFRFFKEESGALFPGMHNTYNHISDNITIL